MQKVLKKCCIKFCYFILQIKSKTYKWCSCGNDIFKIQSLTDKVEWKIKIESKEKEVKLLREKVFERQKVYVVFVSLCVLLSNQVLEVLKKLINASKRKWKFLLINYYAKYICVAVVIIK